MRSINDYPFLIIRLMGINMNLLKYKLLKLIKPILIILLSGFCNSNYATIVQTIVQTQTSSSKSWSYTVEDAGDYQVGEAWMHVIQGDSAILEVFVNSKRVNAIYGLSGEVNRFETRMEGLKKGDKIIVKAHARGTTYKLEYKTAFGTPVFTGLSTFDVSDYGAKGDGTTNDQVAIANAIQAAKSAGGGIVRFDYTKTYRIEGGQIYAFDLSDTKNIKIVGINPENPIERARLLLKSPVRVANIFNSENIQIDGFIVDYYPLPYWQSEIIDANTSDWTIDVKVYDRYPVPVISDWDWEFGRTFIPDTPGSRSGTGAHVYVDRVEQIPDSTDGRKLRIYADATISKTRAAVTDCANGLAKELLMRNFETTSEISYTFIIQESSRVLISNFRFYRVPKQGISPSQNYGPITLYNVEFRIPDASEDSVFNRETELFESWRGHYLMRNNRFGVLFDQAEHDGGCMFDDMYNGHSHLAIVNAVNGATFTCSINENGSNWAIGDWVSVWNYQQYRKYGEARIVGVNYSNNNKQIVVSLDKYFSDVVAGDATLVNEELLNRGTIIRNWSITDLGPGRASFRIRTPVIFKDCHFNNSFVWPNVELEREGPRPRGVVFEDVYFKGEGNDTPLNIKDAIDAELRRCIIDSGLIEFKGEVNRVLMDSVVWINSPGDIINMSGQDTAYLFGNYSRNGQTELISDWVSLNDQSVVYYANPPNYPVVVPAVEDSIPNGIIQDKQNNKISIFPNPAKETITVQMNENIATADLKLFSIEGINVFSTRLFSEKQIISIRDIKSGIYFLNIANKEILYSTKLIIH